MYYSGTLYLFHGYHFKMALKHVKAKNGKLKKGIIICFNFVAIKKNYYYNTTAPIERAFRICHPGSC
jgi:hypothetical protein